MASSMEIVGHAANIMQVTGIDPLVVVSKIIEVADTVESNQELCKELAAHAYHVRDLLPYLMDSALWQHQEMRRPLEELYTTLILALDLVLSCKRNRNKLLDMGAAKKVATKLRCVQMKIDRYCQMIPFILAAFGFKTQAAQAAQGHTNPAPPPTPALAAAPAERRQWYPLKDVNPDSQQWCVMVRAVRFSKHHTADQPPRLIRVDFIMLDQLGNAMEAQIPGQWVHKYRHLLMEDHVYYINSFEVLNARSSNCAVDHPYMARFTKYTHIKEESLVHHSFPLYACSVVPYSVLRTRVKDFSPMSDAIGLLVKCSCITTQKARNARQLVRNVHITDGSETIVVELRGAHAEEFQAEAYMAMASRGPVALLFVATTVHISRGRLRLQGSASCKWYVNPALPDAAILLDRHGSKLPKPQWIHPTVTTVTALSNTENPHDIWGKRYTVKAKIKGLVAEEPWWYMACTECNKKATPNGMVYKCSKSRCSGTAAKPRYRLTMIATDPDTSESEEEPQIELVAFGTIGDELVGMPVEPLIDAGGGMRAFIPQAITRLHGRQYELRVTVSRGSFRSENTSFRIISVCGAIVPVAPLNPSTSQTADEAGPSGTASEQAEDTQAIRESNQGISDATPVKDILDTSAGILLKDSATEQGPPQSGEPTEDLEDTDTETSGVPFKRRRTSRKLQLEADVDDE